jgi:signal transduction histidine kinase
MGDEVLLVTQPADEPGINYLLDLRWSDFASAEVVEDVELYIRSETSEECAGTRIEISGLRKATEEREVRRLARELLLLADPFGDREGFKLELIAPEFKEIEDLVRTAYFDDCEFRLVADLDEKGFGSAKVFDRSGGVRWKSSEDDFTEPYQAPVMTFELWVFLLQGSSFAGRSATVAEVRRWLEHVGGVHLYHRGLRVRPYGDLGHDWLDMNLRRAQDPELRPSTNTAVGRVTVIDEGGTLLQKTDRTGFIEDDAFHDLRRFSIDALEWMHEKRLGAREEQNGKEKRQSQERTNSAKRNFQREVDRLTPDKKESISKAASEVESARALEEDQLRDELTLYKTLASVGTAVSVFAHEIEGPATELTASVGAIERRIRKALATTYESTVGNQVDAIKRSAELVSRFATLPLGMLKRSKRRRTVLDVNEVVRDTLLLLDPYLNDARVETTYQLSYEAGLIHSSIAAIEAILSNLITNSVKAFRRPDAELGNRRLVVRTELVGDNVHIVVLDSGPGIKVRPVERIWLPGFTTEENGTGLGLTIVRDTVAELGGRVGVIPQGELGGAEFTVKIPRVGLGQ